jgi:hypothetical protein
VECSSTYISARIALGIKNIGIDMNSLIVENPDGTKIFNIIGRGVVLAIPYGLYGREHNVGDVWNFTFPYCEKKVTVRGVERFSYPTSPVGLCFGGQLSEEDIRYIKDGKFNFCRI